ncbi:hypothetical protein O181_068455 [Austropuccinia psidii MF-1]|uniref:Uncharacterized protein n=1 Tax=Austropuccinia psidii MF-1 TaxID=1389203 RepID=A0A9Q3F114_9BASI|nr:hypothetical protein [Austropuccinia psidii MF-1]
MSKSNRYKSHSEGTDRNLHETVLAVLHGVKGQRLGNVSKIHQGVMNSRHNLKRFLNKEEIVRYSNRWNSTSSKPKIKKIKNWHKKKRKASKEEPPVPSASKPPARKTAQQGRKNKKKNWRIPYYPSYSIQRIKKDAMNKVFNMSSTLMEFKDKEDLRMQKPHVPKI